MTITLWILILIGIWLISAPIGYLATRWGDRAMSSRWTRNDRIAAIVFSLFYGPFMPILVILYVLCHKLENSDWGNQEVRW